MATSPCAGRVAATPGTAQRHENCVTALHDLAELVRGRGVTLVLEQLNPVFLPGYLWDSTEKRALTIARVHATF